MSFRIFSDYLDHIMICIFLTLESFRCELQFRAILGQAKCERKKLSQMDEGTNPSLGLRIIL